MSEPLEDRVVAAIGHQYELETEIGRGGMSVVCRARDLRLNRPVAVKALPPELAYDSVIRTRFTREAQTSAQLSHAHIVPIYDVGERDGLAYLVMALIPGGNLGILLAREPRQPIAEVRRLLCEIADALADAHLHGQHVVAHGAAANRAVRAATRRPRGLNRSGRRGRRCRWPRRMRSSSSRLTSRHSRPSSARISGSGTDG